LLEDPSRTTTRAGRAVHLLSYIVLCVKCGGPTSKQPVKRRGWVGVNYSCLYGRCASVTADVLDEFVQRAVVAWLARPEVFEELSADAASDEQVAHARAEAQRLRKELEDWRKLAEAGEVLAQIAQHEATAKEAGIPPVLRGRIGDKAVAAWAELGDEVAVKRDIIRTVADIRLKPAGKGSRKPFGRHRLEWTWKFGTADVQGDTVAA
jgi:site-specific DNA recombinase